MKEPKFPTKFLKEVYDALDKSCVFVTGPAGVGKSTFIRNFRDYVHSKHAKEYLAVTATTGVAAINLEGMTIHSFLGTMIKTNIQQFKPSYFRGKAWAPTKKRIQETKILIIDEVSMIRADYLDLINDVLQIANNTDELFGGLKIVFVGDFHQLPPVIKSHEEVKHEYAFESLLWKDLNMKTFYLSEIKRQDDPEFTDILMSIREGQITNGQAKKLLTESSKEEVGVKFVSTNKVALEYNNRELAKINEETHKYKSHVKAENKKDEERMIKDCIADDTLILKEGAKVMLLTNDSSERYFNGSLGTVVNCGYSFVDVKLDNGPQVKITENQWTQYGPTGEVLAIMEQLPIKLAYAVTIHKSQGLTFDEATIDARNMFANGQLYVALSRVRTLKGLCIQNLKPWSIKSSQKVKDYYETIKK